MAQSVKHLIRVESCSAQLPSPEPSVATPFAYRTETILLLCINSWLCCERRLPQICRDDSRQLQVPVRHCRHTRKLSSDECTTNDSVLA